MPPTSPAALGPRSTRNVGGVLLLASIAAASARGQEAFRPPPGSYRTSWVGNSFGGDGGGNGKGRWVQNGADEIEVTPDGVVFAGVSWDEAGRCAGLYKDGAVNRDLLKQRDGRPGPETAWGWGTANNAVAADGEVLYVASLGKKLLRFRREPGGFDAARYVDEVDLPEVAVGLAARGGRVAVVYPDSIEFRRDADLAATGRVRLAGARDAAFAADGTLWALAGDAVRHLSAEGVDLGVVIPGPQKPSAVSVDPAGRVLVCDDGPRQQVLIYDVSAAPRLASAFGDEGGLRSGTPGRVAPGKLFALKGAGADAAGNLYVALSFGNGPAGNLVLRSFDPAGRPRWELASLAFVDTFGFDPDSDGAVVYGRTATFDLDLSRAGPGREWSLRAMSVDPAGRPDDDRLKYGCTTLLRRVGGRRVLYAIGQYAGGYRLHTFDGPDGLVARQVDRVGGPEQWAWHVDSAGSIWHGDAPDRTIRRYPFRGWKADGTPDYDWAHPDSWPRPGGWELIRRIMYDPAGDSLYLFGYLDGQSIDSWGVVGPTARRHDGWLAGRGEARWTNRALPINARGSDQGGPLTASAVDVAGDYLFLGMVKPDDGQQHVHILKTSDGTYVGSLAPGPEVGGQAGWQDMPYSVQALRRKDGEYLVLVEEDFRGKNLLYRWRPEVNAAKP